MTKAQLEDTIEQAIRPESSMREAWVILANALSSERKDRLRLPGFVSYVDGVFELSKKKAWWPG